MEFFRGFCEGLWDVYGRILLEFLRNDFVGIFAE